MKKKVLMINGKKVAVRVRDGKASVKAVDTESGIVEAYVSIFGNVDSANEVVEKGAFAESLNRKLPKVAWSHNWDEIIGKVLEAREDDKGLYVKFQLILSVQKAKEAYELMKSGAMDEFSIGYSVDESLVDMDGIRHLQKLTLYEVSPVMVGCNPDTELLSVKSAQTSGEEEEPKESVEKSDTEKILEAIEKNNELMKKTMDAVSELQKSMVAVATKEASPKKVDEGEKKDNSQAKVVSIKYRDELITEARKGVKSLNKVLFTLKRAK